MDRLRHGEKGAVTLGSLLTFYALTAYFTTPIKNLIELQPTIQSAIIAADRLNDVLDLSPEMDERGDVIENPGCWELKNVDFRYGNRELLLKNVSMHVERGEKIAIVGESGSGKTTLVKLLMRFYTPESGEVLIDGKNVNELELTGLRGRAKNIRGFALYVQPYSTLPHQNLLRMREVAKPQGFAGGKDTRGSM